MLLCPSEEPPETLAFLHIFEKTRNAIPAPAFTYSRTHSQQNVSCPRHDCIWRNRGIAPLIPNLGNRGRWVVITPRPLYPRERTQAPTECMAGWTSEPIRTFRKRYLFPLPGIEPIFLSAACNQVTISTELSELVEVMLLNIIWWRVISLTLRPL
jgi:hypothetical protein